MSTPVLIKDLAETSGKAWFTSMENVMRKTSIGSDVVDFLKNSYEPEVFKTADLYMKQGHPIQGKVNPSEAWNLARRDVTNSAFGKSKQGLIPILQAAQKQGGPMAASELANTFSNYFRDESPYWREAAIKKGVQISGSSPYRGDPKHFESIVRRISSPIFLPFISIPHATQAPLNSLLVNGAKATLQTFAEFMRSPSSAIGFADQVGVLSLEAKHEFENSLRSNSSFRLLLDPLRKVFNFERRWGIAFSALSGKWAAIDAASEFAATQSKKAELQLKVLGLDPQAILRQGGQLTADDIERAAFRAASEIMGFKSPLETPYKWDETPSLRIMNLYKHYGFRQAKLLKDTLVRAKEAEGLKGVAKITATLGTAFFAVGEMNKIVEETLRGRDPYSKDEEKNNLFGSEYLDGIAHAGGFGIMYSIMRSAKHNHLAGYFAGPVLSSTFDILQDIGNARGRSLARDVGRKFGLPGVFITNQILPPNKRSQSNKSFTHHHHYKRENN